MLGWHDVRRLLITWAAAWVTITALLTLLGEMIEQWPLMGQTLLLTGLMVPLMQAVVPLVTQLTDHRS
ncbi:hypothetical protein [uncultured Tateyamaria sp.]|uniref:hypothetical protein n=1 Tax=uncultured Tateyamaria sp. TaxID=455651 RepID=UPI00260D32AA|nr:hypothetical protein [uncultured Tateyamaria sp.]